jgi:hypothetical protein
VQPKSSLIKKSKMGMSAEGKVLGKVANKLNFAQGRVRAKFYSPPNTVRMRRTDV